MSPSAVIEAAKQRRQLLVEIKKAQTPQTTPEGKAMQAVIEGRCDGGIEAWEGAIHLLRMITY